MKDAKSETNAGPWIPGEICARLERDGRDFLALRVRGIPSRCSGSRLNEMMTEPGLIVKPAQDGDASGISEWKIERREISEGEWVFMGPDFRGRSLSGLIASVSAEESAAAALSALERVARALVAAKARQGRYPGFFSASVLVGQAGEVLFLPASLSRGCIDRLQVGRSDFERVDLDIGRHPSQYVTAALREIVLRADGGHPDPRASGLLLSRFAPRLHPALLAAEEAYQKRTAKYFPIERWLAAFAQAQGGFFRPSDERKAESERAMKAKTLERAGRRAELRAAVKRARPAFIAAAALAVLAAIVVPPVLRSRAESRKYLEYSPERVIAAYYAGYSELNDQEMDLCVKKKTVQGDINTAIALSITLKVRLGSEGRDPFVRAAQWLAAGRPAIRKDDYIFGITDLAVEALPGPGPRKSFRASYTLWSTVPGQDEMGYERSEVKDSLGLERTDLGWKISSLEREQGQPIAQTVSYAK